MKDEGLEAACHIAYFLEKLHTFNFYIKAVIYFKFLFVLGVC